MLFCVYTFKLEFSCYNIEYSSNILLNTNINTLVLVPLFFQKKFVHRDVNLCQTNFRAWNQMSQYMTA